jgi:hypothetical protein
MGVPGFSLGGKIGQTGTAHAGVGKLMDRWGTLIQAAGVKQAMAFGGGMLGGASGPGGWRWMIAALRSAFPGLALISGYRPGAITATGNRSYHAMGRAVDVPPRMDVFNWIRGTYGKRTRELIFSPANNRQVWNGRPHLYTGITRANHWDHVHWAFGKGGRIPEDVFGVGRSGRTYGFHGGETVVPKREPVSTEVTVNVTLSGAVMLTDQRALRDLAEKLEPPLRTAMLWAQRR